MIQIALDPLRAVDLVGNEDEGDAGPQQQPGDALIVVGDWAGGVGDEEHQVGAGDGDLGLAPDAGRQLLVGVQLPTAGVDEKELPTRPLGVELAPIAGHAGLLVDHGRRCGAGCG